jgi:hypothetical protein
MADDIAVVWLNKTGIVQEHWLDFIREVALDSENALLIATLIEA